MVLEVKPMRSVARCTGVLAMRGDAATRGTKPSDMAGVAEVVLEVWALRGVARCAEVLATRCVASTGLK